MNLGLLIKIVNYIYSIYYVRNIHWWLYFFGENSFRLHSALLCELRYIVG